MRKARQHGIFMIGLLGVAGIAMAGAPRAPWIRGDKPAATSTPARDVSSSRPSAEDQAAAPGKARVLDLGAGVQLILVYVPGGRFLMGSPNTEREPIKRELAGNKDNPITQDVLYAMRLESPVHEVELDGFWMAKYEVTVAQFRQFVEATSYQTDAGKRGESQMVSPPGGWSKVPGLSWRKPGFPQGDNHPVVHVSWNDARAFCEWLSRRDASDFRLPTEAEWEYACRARTRTAYQWGDDPKAAKGWLNAADQRAKEKYPSWPCLNFDDGYLYTSPVGSFKANGFGLHDMHGNVWEWCGDWFGEKYYAESPRRNPQGPPDGKHRIARGGSWDYYQNLYRSAVRVPLPPTSTYCGQGFRVACAVKNRG